MDPIAYDTAYRWVQAAIDLTWVAWIIIGPLIFMRLLIKFLGWSRRQSKSETFDNLSDQIDEGYNNGLRGRMDRLGSATKRWRK